MRAEPWFPLQRLWRRVDSRIGLRLGLSFGLLCLLMILMAAVAAWQSRTLLGQFGTAIDDRIPILTRLQSLSREVNSVNLAARDSLLAADEAAAAALGRIEAGRTKIGEEIGRIQALLQGADARGQALSDELGTHSSGVLVTLLKFARMRKAGQAGPSRDLLAAELLPKMESFSAAIDRLQALQIQHLETGRDEAAAAVRFSLGVTGAVLTAALVVSGLLAWRIGRAVTSPVIDTVRLAERIAAGDLSNRPAAVRRDELGRLQQAVLDMQRQLAELVGSIRQSAGNLAVASSEIADGSQHLSRRTEEAAGSLQRTAGSMEQLAGTVRRSADSARVANQLAASAAEAAVRGGSVVNQVVERMAEISQASGKIADITAVIDGIAFQTNILALNAAVEAARAGEHGKGFAVVAAEVRTLAQRAAMAAREIKSLIGESADRVESGSRLVQDAGSTMRDIVAGVQRVTDVVGEICAASSSQSAGLGEVNTAVGHLEAMTQQNAALVEQSAAAAESLRDQARGLQSLVNRFQLEHEPAQ
jgi:methyl-accepting chemotaxis protein